MKKQFLDEKQEKVQGTLIVKSKNFTNEKYFQLELEGPEFAKLGEAKVGDLVKVLSRNAKELKEKLNGEKPEKPKSVFVITAVNAEAQTVTVESIIIDATNPFIQMVLEAEAGQELFVKVKSGRKGDRMHHGRHGEKALGQKGHGRHGEHGRHHEHGRGSMEGHHGEHGHHHGHSRRGEPVVFASAEQIAAAEERLSKLFGGSGFAGKEFGGKGEFKGHGMKHGHHRGKRNKH